MHHALNRTHRGSTCKSTVFKCYYPTQQSKMFCDNDSVNDGTNKLHSTRYELLFILVRFNDNIGMFPMH